MALSEEGIQVEQLHRSLDYRGPWTPNASRGPRELCRSRRVIHQDFRDVLEQIRLKAPRRFSHAREVLRILGSGSSSAEDGFLERCQARAFFRAFDLSADRADRFFEHLAAASDHGDTVSYRSFLKHVGPFIELPGIEAAMQSAGWGSRARPWLYNELWYNRDGSPTPREVQHCREQAEHLGLRKAPLTPRRPFGENERSPKTQSSSRRPLNASDQSQLLAGTASATAIWSSPADSTWAAARTAQENASASLLPSGANDANALASSSAQLVDTAVAAAVPAEAPAVATTEEVKPSPEGGPAALMAGGRPLARPFGQPRGSRAPHRGRTLVAQVAT